ncbi:MAG: hypothetical protein RBS73_07835 [Prolixibacteraceae bacterium]|jgi:DNA mismatch repair ATPase MutS|nr:hypothetical protein [Prolixibacteraceae bacterium]
MNAAPRSAYQELLNGYQLKLQQTARQLRWVALSRLTIFLLTVALVIYLWDFGVPVVMPVTAVLFAFFLYLIKIFILKEKEKQFYQNLVRINEEELKALDGDFSSFAGGSEFIDIHHPFSFDLDLFGPRSFFQFLNRASTRRGQKRLAYMLANHETDQEKIRQKQEAVQELAEELNWRQHFAAKGKTDSDQRDFDLISQWLSASFQLKNEQAVRLAIAIFPVLTLIVILLNIFSLVPWGMVLLFVLSQWAVYGFSAKTIQRFHQQFGSRSEILSKYIEMLLDIEKKDFQSGQLRQLKQKLYFQDQSASRINSRLIKLIAQLDYGRNMVLTLIFNSVFLWDLRCIYRLSKWHQQYHHLLDQWFEVIAEFDALSCFGNYNFNHAEGALPVPENNRFTFEAEQLGHPLISDKKRVNNDFLLNDNGKLAIITGANMAGKSTFLRTVGINLVLAMNGCKVCATRMKFTPIALYTNMRTTDNLMNDESYFYAELLRLQQMLERIRNGEKLFVIIDEMLKGTNSVDKLNGSKELIKQLISLKVVGIVATHDLKLTELVTQYPGSIQNQCFEVQLTNDDLSFDYRLRTGVTQTMNATFLMKKMGIIG